MGPTASGKSALAENLAERFDTPIINADAFQIYRKLDIGTAKPKNRSRYQLLDLVEPEEEYGVGEYVVTAAGLLHEYFAAGQSVIICGGSGLYVRALIEEYRELSPAPEPELRRWVSDQEDEVLLDLIVEKLGSIPETLDIRNRVRLTRFVEKLHTPAQTLDFSLPAFQKLKVAICPPVEESAMRIEMRVNEMLRDGWTDEVQSLMSSGISYDAPGMRAIGYREVWDHLQSFENADLSDLAERIKLLTVQYAKRQRTWLRSEPQLVTFESYSQAQQELLKVL